MTKIYKIGFDIGGVLSAYPEQFKTLINALEQSPHFQVYYITDMPRATAEELLTLNEIQHNPERLLCADWNSHQNECKTRLANEVGLDFLVDDHLAYLIGETNALGLLVVPKSKQPYNHQEWKTKK